MSDNWREPPTDQATLERRARWREASHRYQATPAGKAAKRRYDATPEAKARRARYKATPQSRAVQRKAASRQRLTHGYQAKHRARRLLSDAVAAGRIPKPDFCDRCDALIPANRLQGHHWNGYAYPLGVQWLCPPCHVLEEHT